MGGAYCQGTAAYPPVTGQGRLNGCGSGVGRLKLVECHWLHPREDTLYQIYIPQTTTDYHLLIVTLLA
jgi:hypothetical protein